MRNIIIVDIENVSSLNWPYVVEHSISNKTEFIFVGASISKSLLRTCSKFKNCKYIESIQGNNSADMLICFLIGGIKERNNSDRIVLFTGDKFGRILNSSLANLGHGIIVPNLVSADCKREKNVAINSYLQCLGILAENDYVAMTNAESTSVFRGNADMPKPRGIEKITESKRLSTI